MTPTAILPATLSLLLFTACTAEQEPPKQMGVKVSELRKLTRASGEVRGRIIDYEGKRSIPNASIELRFVHGRFRYGEQGRLQLGFAQTDENGEFSFDLDRFAQLSLASRSQILIEVRPRIPGWQSDWHSADDGESVDRGFIFEIKLLASEGLTGQVITNEGEPVPGAAVATLKQPQDGQFKHTRTDARGVFILPLSVTNNRSISIIAAHESYGRAAPQTVELRSGKMVAIENLRLQKLTPGLHGKASYPDGSKATDLCLIFDRVKLDGEDTPRYNDIPLPAYLPTPGKKPPLPDFAPGLRISVQTDQEGKFSMITLPRGEFEIGFGAAGDRSPVDVATQLEYDPIPLSNKPGNLTVTVPAGIADLNVSDQGDPLPDAVVSLIVLSGDQAHAERERIRNRAERIDELLNGVQTSARAYQVERFWLRGGELIILRAVQHGFAVQTLVHSVPKIPGVTNLHLELKPLGKLGRLRIEVRKDDVLITDYEWRLRVGGMILPLYPDQASIAWNNAPESMLTPGLHLGDAVLEVAHEGTITTQAVSLESGRSVEVLMRLK